MRISHWSSDVCSSDLSGCSADRDVRELAIDRRVKAPRNHTPHPVLAQQSLQPRAPQDRTPHKQRQKPQQWFEYRGEQGRKIHCAMRAEWSGGRTPNVHGPQTYGERINSTKGKRVTA